MNCQAREIFVSKRYCTSFISYEEGSFHLFFWNEYLILDSENLCVQNMDLELIWNGSSTLLSMIGLSWMKNIELTPRCIYTANLPLSLFNTKDTQVQKALCEFLTIKNGITSKSAILLTRISFQRSQREYGEGRIGTAHWAQVPGCKDAQNKQITMKQN